MAPHEPTGGGQLSEKRISVDNTLSALMVIEEEAPEEVVRAIRLLRDYLTNEDASGFDRNDILIVLE
jgi:hypothetical protein